MADKVSCLAACKTAYDEALALNGQSGVDAQFAAKDQQLAAKDQQIAALKAQLDAVKGDAAALDQADASADAARAKLHTDAGG